ncbi:acyltransferase [Pseudaeromonas paramecii]|uniref:Acyltransferase 3 domain-containing protein n=1 Tax=Pseudaeromonas paramecii TaxID=2138166 RepID=A0ABP8PUA2_9GAMM
MDKHRADEIPALDGLRALACILVVLSHLPEYFTQGGGWLATGLPLGQVGVALFFGLSGFLMTHLYVGSSFTLSRVLNYLIARFSRIAPAYWLTIVLCFLLFRFVDPEFVFRIDEHNLLRHLLFLGSEGVFWSIPPEIQYYLFFLLFWGAWQQWLQGRKMLLILLTLACVGLMASREAWPGILLPSKLHFFLSGTLAAMLFHRLRQRLTLSCWLLAGLQCLMVLVLTVSVLSLHGMSEQTFYGHSGFYLLVALALLVLSFPSRIMDFMLGNRLLGWFGKVSFSVYLLHCPVIYLFNRFCLSLGWQGAVYDGLALLLALLLPGLFSQWVELPLCNLAKRRGQQWTKGWLARRAQTAVAL